MGTKVIGVQLDGRLGNQMFQYAFAIATAEKLGVPFEMLQGHQYKDEVREFFELPAFPPGISFKRLRRKWFYMKILKERIPVITENQNELLVALPDNALYNGFFQNDYYFSQYRQKIVPFFKIKEQHRRAFLEESKNIDFERNIVVHMRLKDYLTWGSEEVGGPDVSLPPGYYQNAFKALGLTKNDNIILVSDDYELARQRLSFLENTIQDFGSSPAIGFQALQSARRLVISNSTFAWWGAWLNTNNPSVYAPQNWLGFKKNIEFPSGIISSRFNCIPVLS